MGRVLLGIDTATEQPVYLDQAQRMLGAYVIGRKGTGKSTFLENLIMQDIEEGIGLCVLDPHGDLIENVLVRLPETRVNDVIYLDMDDAQWPFGLNIVACADTSNSQLVEKTAEQFVHIFKKLWGEGETASWGPRLEDLLSNIAYTLLANPGFTIAHVPKLLYDDAFRSRLVANVNNQDVQDYWTYEYDTLRDAQQQEIRASTLNKVRPFVRNQLVRRIVGQGGSKLDFRAFMDEQRIVLVRLNVELETATALLGATIVAQVLNAALSRRDMPEEERKKLPFHLYADEFHRFATPAFSTLIHEARKYGVATIIAHQERFQLDEKYRRDPLGAGTIVVFTIPGEDAKDLSLEFNAEPRPGERVLKMVTEPVYEQQVDTTWDPPEAERQYEELAKEREFYYRQWVILLLKFGRHKAGVGRMWSKPEREQRNIVMEMIEEDAPAFHGTFLWYEKFAEWEPEGPPWGVINNEIKRMMQAWRQSSGSDMSVTRVPHALVWLKEKLIWLEEKFTSIDKQRQQLLDTCRTQKTYTRYLYDRPVKDIVGLYSEEQRYEWIDGPEEPIANARNRIANELAHMRQYHARIKLLQAGSAKEFIIQTIALPKPPSGLDVSGKIARIKEHTRQFYCRWWEDVDKEIDTIQHLPAYSPNRIPPHNDDDDDEADYLSERKQPGA